MRPVRLVMEGFSAFRSRTELEFGDVDLFALVGPTGAGKSSVIDGITNSNLLQSGDGFLLMTDALAAYVLRAVVDDGDSIETALPFRRPAGFREWIAARRDDRSLRNDDVSLLRVRVI